MKYPNIDRVWSDRKELEPFRNIERKAAHQLRLDGHEQPIVFRQR